MKICLGEYAIKQTVSTEDIGEPTRLLNIADYLDVKEILIKSLLKQLVMKLIKGIFQFDPYNFIESKPKKNYPVIMMIHQKIATVIIPQNLKVKDQDPI